MVTQSCESDPFKEADFGMGYWTCCSAIFLENFSSLYVMKEKEENVTKMRKNKKLGEIFSPIFKKEMRLAYVVVVRNQASVNKINNYLITFNVS